jgi:hypothetical protein
MFYDILILLLQFLSFPMHTDTSLPLAGNPTGVSAVVLVPTSERYSLIRATGRKQNSTGDLASPGVIVSSARTAGRTECLLAGPRARRSWAPLTQLLWTGLGLGLGLARGD